VKFVLNKISFESCKKEGEEISFARLLHSAVLSFFFLPSSLLPASGTSPITTTAPSASSQATDRHQSTLDNPKKTYLPYHTVVATASTLRIPATLNLPQHEKHSNL
jgi:hypothetical protein